MRALLLAATPLLAVGLVIGPAAPAGPPRVDTPALVRQPGDPAGSLAQARSSGSTPSPGLEPAIKPASRAAAAEPSTWWGWPLAPQPEVVRGFEPPLHNWLPGHRGVDLLAHPGQPVLAAGDGVVSFSGLIAGAGMVTVSHAHGLRTTYQPVVARLARGTIVHKGQQIGAVSGPSHCAPRLCLHWGLLRGDTYLNPLMLLGLEPPVLLPLP